MPWTSKADRKYRYKEAFTLQTSPGLPQSELDKTIFHPNWKLRGGWEGKKGESKDGHPMFIFRQRDQDKRIMGVSYSEDFLATERSKEFKMDYQNGQPYYRPMKRTFHSYGHDLRGGRCGYR
ncbi:hypothetical protein N7486_011156 [Penicillium sp. IBT 16267x]|nr:hypothetical protein N7486_011156 [Penicillium sp. IBT 16267x]